jgi:protein-S-isoprenylcysteine O-methyltransferase Ste14
MTGDRRRGWAFVIIQVALIILIILSTQIENNLLNPETILFLHVLSIILMAASIICFAVTFYYFKQPITPSPVPLENIRLKTNGIYSVIRHPMYFSAILLLTGYILYRSAYYTLLLCLAVIIFLVTKIRYEEKLLSAHFAEYKEYQKRTKKLIPFVY